MNKELQKFKILSPELEEAYQDYLGLDPKCSRVEFLTIIEDSEKLPESITTKLKTTTPVVIKKTRSVALSDCKHYDKINTFQEIIFWDLTIRFVELIFHIFVSILEE